MGKSAKKRQRQRQERQLRERQSLESTSEWSGRFYSSNHGSSPISPNSKGLRADFVERSSAEPPETQFRKRARRQLDFLYPRENGRLPFFFRFRSKDSQLTASVPRLLASFGARANIEAKNIDSSESIDDMSLRRIPEEGEAKDKDSLSGTAIMSEHRIEGHLSGLSVEEAVRDKSGCRPRSNSTDGELNLPRRGLCDEHMVLQSHRWKDSLKGRSPRGFVNLGNSCFLNSTLQCLAYLPPFCQSLLAMKDRKPAEKGGKSSQGKRITLMMKSLFQKFDAQGGAIAPRDVVESLPSLGACGGRYGGYKFRLGRQEDAHEFLVHLLDAMHDGELMEAGINRRKCGWRDRLPIPRLDETTFIHRIFGGYLRSQLECPKCKYCSNTYDPFLDIALEVSGKGIESVGDAFAEFTRQETLDSKNRWKCGGCGQRVRAKKAMTVFRPPLSLCVQMKRFAFGDLNPGFHFNSVGAGRGNKITKAIAFPAEMKLPLSDYRSCDYTLTGVVIHIGGSSDSGHYTAYVKNPRKGKSDQWYHVDDSYVQAVSEKTVLQQKNAYLLFYSRKEVKLEFPPPPCRAYLSAEQATEFRRARARARADNSSQLNAHEIAMNRAKEYGATTNDVAAHDRTQKIVEDAFSVTVAEPANLNCPEHSSNSNLKKESTPTQTRRTSPVGERSATLSCSSSRSSSDSSSDASEGNEKHAQKDETKAEEDCNEMQSKHCSRQNALPSRESSPRYSPRATTENHASDGDETESSATTSSRLDSDSSSCGGPKPKKSVTNVPAPVQPFRWLNQEGSHSCKSDKLKKMGPALPRVFQPGRGGETGPVVGPKFKKRKGLWNPQTSGTTKGVEYELLGNRAVDKWGDSTDPTEHDTKILQARSQVVDRMDTESRAQKRKMFPDHWDASLDRGRVKKVKQKGDNGDATSHFSPSPNSFQRILFSMQKIKHGRPKSQFGKQPSHINGKRRRICKRKR